jgi:hypothetical protein
MYLGRRDLQVLVAAIVFMTLASCSSWCGHVSNLVRVLVAIRMLTISL